jgi:ABC-type transport system substrate-binding protein
MKRRQTLALGAATGAAAATALPQWALAADAASAASSAKGAASSGALAAPISKAAPGQRVLRYAFRVAETGFDPAQINDAYSRYVTAHIFESLYCYDYLARPGKIVPLVADGMPLVEDNYRQWTFKVRPGIFFTDDPAFKATQGKGRELVAQDFLFALRRYADPVVKSPLWASMESYKILGLAELRKVAIDNKKPLDYDAPVEGLRLLDRYTLQLRLSEPRPRFIESMAVSDVYGAVAREVVQAYGSDIPAHPVGTGPFKLAQWRRSSLIVLERNPGYRERLWEATPNADDAEGQAIAAKLRGRRIPMLDRVEVAIIEEQQPRWLSFVNGEYNLIERVPEEFIQTAMPARKVAPNLAKKGFRGAVTLASDITFTYFNMEDKLVGGNEPHKVALRRAISLGVDLEREIRLVRRGMAVPAQGPILPHTTNYEPGFRSEMSEYNPSKAKALLELYGYADRNGDGWREQPNGEPLLLNIATQSDQQSRALNELWERNMKIIGIQVEFKTAQWPENLKAARNGKLQVWALASSAAGGDSQGMITRYYGPQAGNQNITRFKLAALDAIHDKLTVLPDGPERAELFREARKLAIAYMPYKLHVHRFIADMYDATVVGYKRPVGWNDWWHMVDVLPQSKAA